MLEIGLINTKLTATGFFLWPKEIYTDNNRKMEFYAIYFENSGT